MPSDFSTGFATGKLEKQHRPLLQDRNSDQNSVEKQMAAAIESKLRKKGVFFSMLESHSRSLSKLSTHFQLNKVCFYPQSY